jgi:hypothetical protein
MTEASEQNNRSANIEPNMPVTKTMVRDLVSWLCLLHNREQREIMDELYWRALSDLTVGQMSQLATLVLKETEFWPSPARLRRLVGIQTQEEREKQAAEVEQRGAKEGLEQLLRSLRPYSRDAQRRTKWIAGLKEQPLAEDPITKALVQFGGGNLETGVEMLCLHPTFKRSDEESESLGLIMNTIDKAEKRWIAAWHEANR